jgi:hypothetical protein
MEKNTATERSGWLPNQLTKTKVRNERKDSSLF